MNELGYLDYDRWHNDKKISTESIWRLTSFCEMYTNNI